MWAGFEVRAGDWSSKWGTGAPRGWSSSWRWSQGSRWTELEGLRIGSLEVFNQVELFDPGRWDGSSP